MSLEDSELHSLLSDTIIFTHDISPFDKDLIELLKKRKDYLSKKRIEKEGSKDKERKLKFEQIKNSEYLYGLQFDDEHFFFSSEYKRKEFIEQENVKLHDETVILLIVPTNKLSDKLLKKVDREPCPCKYWTITQHE